MKSFLFTLFFVKLVFGSPTPIVLWHGMGDTCCLPFSLGAFKYFLEKQIPGVHVHSLKIGDSSIEDLENGYFMSPNEQVEYVCNQLAENQNLTNGFHAIGFSQGGQFLRGVIQRCGHHLPPVKSLVTMGAQHQGVYGLPKCLALQHKSCDYLREALNYAAYNNWLQDTIVQATYWHDPLNEDLYKHHSHYLADINNELNVNQTYIDNLSSLENFIMVKFDSDSMVQPSASEWFGYYAPGQAEKLLTLQESEIYIQDRLGLKAMDKAGKLVFLSQPGDHLRFSDTWFIEKILKPYLM